jgi:hypothetical protein
MGFVSCTGTCYTCRKLITFNPNKVPSIRINGVKEPVCRECITAANPKRKANGMPEITILPGAYEAAPEEEIVW